MDEWDKLEEKVRAALAVDLLDKLDMAIVTLNLKTAKEVRWMLKGMIDAAKEASNGLPD